MLNRYCYSVRLGISRHSIAFSQILRFSNTSNDGSASSEAEEDFQKSKPSIKTVHKIKKSKSSTPEAKTNENLKPENIRTEKRKKKPKPSEVAAEEILKAVDSVVKDLQYNGISDERKTKNELIGKLIEYEKEKFEAATSAQYSELLSDKDFATFLESLKDETVRPPPRAVEKRRMRQGLLLLKREIFYQALQSGHKAEDARRIAERAVTIAEERAIGKHEVLVQNYVEKQEKNILKEIEQTEKENTFYNIALQLASKMLYPDDPSSDEPHIAPSNVIHPDYRVANIFDSTGNKLNIFKKADIPKLKDHSMKFWCEWDKNAAVIWNQSFGPTNAFEEMIELTEQGKMWPYPIDNEYQIGEEEDVNFYDHIFLDKYLAQYDLPEEGPVAQFMELVCVGLSKILTCLLTISKKKQEKLSGFRKVLA
ncbi:28S ribosomal protein S31, mitochondrial [Dirofilaria immitis]|nr:28S ribosomal protein S31, mitochondrial [Dirofilaria immitis]